MSIDGYKMAARGFDFVETVCYAIGIYVLAPFWMLQIFLRQKCYTSLWFLSRYCVASQCLHAWFNAKLRRYDRAVVYYECALAVLEEEILSAKVMTEKQKNILHQIYRILTQLQLRRGNLEDACHVVIRAGHALGCDHIEGLENLNVRVAHITRGAIAAAKIFREELTLVDAKGVRTPVPQEVLKPKSKAFGRGKIIPFPKPT